MSNQKTKKHGSVLILGGGISGMQASLDLANGGFKVHLVQKESSIGGTMSMLDKTFPTGDCAMCMLSPKMVEVGRHLNIDIHSCSELVALEGEAGNFTATIKQKTRYVDLSKCTGCEDCVKKCPVYLSSEFDQALVKRTAISRRYAQAVPGAVAIDKEGVSPCRIECPAEVNAHAYVALIGQRRFKEALEVVRKKNPFPAVCGRICTHPCESGCSRKDIDEPVSICALKRFLTDWEDANGGFQKPELSEMKSGKVAIIGSGPAGMTCARDLALKGYQVVIFEKMPVAGGMLSLAIPEYRLPKDVVKKEIDSILSHGIEVRCNQALGRDFTLEDLKRQGFQSVFISVGTHQAMKLPFDGASEAKGIFDCLEFLRKVALGESVTIGRKVVVIGGGNVAVDAALTAKRLGAQEVRMVCLEKCDEMPAYSWELEQVHEEGIVIDNSWGVNRVLVQNGVVTGIEVKCCTSVFDAKKRFNPEYDACQLSSFDADTIIFAIGMKVDPLFANGVLGLDLLPDNRIKTDPSTLQTSMKPVFAGGDAVSGPSTIIQAIASGAQAAVSIDRFLKGEDLYANREKVAERNKAVKDLARVKRLKRVRMPQLPVAAREANFHEIDLGLSEDQAVYEASRCLSCSVCSECMMCVSACEAKAIHHEMESEQLRTLQVGAVILAPGLDRYDPSRRGELGFGRWPNVVTSLQFERILSASGPYQGVVTRPRDGNHPIKIAWIQCVGSRDPHHANAWCSSVCCMYATKQAIIAKEHDNRIEPTIFYTEMRSYGKDFDKYVERAKNEYGARYVRSMISIVREEAGTGNLVLCYAKEDGSFAHETFDLVVLSIGLQPHSDSARIAQICNIKTNPNLFPAITADRPVDTTRDGIFVTGAYQGPKDIPESVMQGSAVAGRVMALLSEARWTETIKKELPPEKDVRSEEPKLGVFVCSCGINIAGTIDVEYVVQQIKDLPGVIHAENFLYSCSQDSQEKIKHLINEKGINRVLVASCTPRTHTEIFQQTIREAGLNAYLFELADIREQCSWCHKGQNEDATSKAVQLVTMMIAKVRLLQPVKTEQVNVTPACLVVGGGIAGVTAALSVAEQGFDVHLVERANELGGLIRNLHFLMDGTDVQNMLRAIIERVQAHPRILVHTKVEIQKTDGFVGNFKTVLSDGAVVDHGAVILATGGIEYQPNEYGYSENDQVITQRELEAKLQNSLQHTSDDVYVMTQCVGSREEPYQYCSRVCCQDAIKNAIKIKEQNSAAQVYILYRDIRTYGLREEYYAKARDCGVIFVRYELNARPIVEKNGDKLRVTVVDTVVNKKLAINADWLVLSVGLRPHPSAEQIGTLYKITRNADGYFLEAHPKLRPVDFATDGLFVAGLAHAPKNFDETISQALAAAGRAGTLLSHDQLTISGLIAKQNDKQCMSCLSCFRICPFGSPYMNDEGKVRHNEVLCQGCGLCAGVCPAKAFQVNSFKDEQILAMIDAAGKPKGAL
ncbi:MAG: FAD-dependent oxidoreductase [Nitrospirota bacterium]